MPKTKTNRGAAKRFRKTGSGKVKRGTAFRRHLLTHKTTKKKRKARSSSYVHDTNSKAVQRLLPY